MKRPYSSLAHVVLAALVPDRDEHEVGVLRAAGPS